MQQVSSFRYSARNAPAAPHHPTLAEIFEDKVRLFLDASPGRPFDVEMRVDVTPGFRRVRLQSSMAVAMTRPSRMLADGDDSLCLILNGRAPLSLTQRGNEGIARPGDGMLVLFREALRLQFSGMDYLAVRVPFTALAPLARNIDATAAQPIPREAEALRLLRSYLNGLAGPIADQRLGLLAATHVYDLIALAVGATADATHAAGRRGVRAARRAAVKADLVRDPGLSLDALAARQGVSPRYVQMLFEDEGTSFSAFALDVRLAAARDMLSGPRHDAWTVTEIAFEAGFGDLSYFNRCFRRRFGMTPSDMRAGVQRNEGHSES